MSGSQSTKSELDKLKKEQVKIVQMILDNKWKIENKQTDNPRDILMILALRKEGWKDEEIESFRQKRGGGV